MEDCYVVVGRYYYYKNNVRKIRKRIAGISADRNVACEIRDYLNNTQTKYSYVVTENEIYDSLSEFRYYND